MAVDDEAQDRHARAVAGGARRAAEGGEGAHPPRRRAGQEEARAALGRGREGLSLRDRGRHEDARRSLRRPLPAARLPLHVRAALRGRLPGLLLDRGHARPAGAPPEGQGHHPAARFPRAACEADRLQGADGLGHRLGLERRQRLQPRPWPPAQRGGAEAVPGGRDPAHRRAVRAHVRDARRRLRLRGTGSERVRAIGRDRLPDLRHHGTRTLWVRRHDEYETS